MPNKQEFTVVFQPVGKRVITDSGQSLLSAAQDAGIDIASICGGVAACDSCKIQLISGDLHEITMEEMNLFSQDEIKSGFRLACQSYPRSDLVIHIPPESLTAPQRLQLEGEGQSLEIISPVKSIDLTMPEPTITDLRSDEGRLKDALIQSGVTPPIEFRYPVLEEISPTLRNQNWHVSLAMRKDTIINILPPGTSLLGLAVDVGTTKLAAYLCDLKTGAILAKEGAMNPQTAYGEDVISRISYADTHANGRKTLQSRLVDTLNQLIQDLCLQAQKLHPGISPGSIVEAEVVGNTAMHHLFAGLPVHQLGVAPYVPAVSDSLLVEAKDIGLNIARGAYVHLPPNIAGYVGADHVAMLLATGLWASKKTAIALDIGTNTEISLMHDNQLTACSCASGPAFEGAHISAGMRAAPGAVERVQFIQNELRIKTIDNLAPVGICGSGILDAVASMMEIGAIDHRGALNSTHPLVRDENGKKAFLLADRSKTGTGKDLVIARQDINEIQLAKGAIRAGVDILLKSAGITADEIEDFIIAGAFGTYINVPSAIKIGMFPDLPINRFHQVGNAAGAGARQLLLSVEQRSIAEQIAKRVKYIELSIYPDFSSIFSRALYL